MWCVLHLHPLHVQQGDPEFIRLPDDNKVCSYEEGRGSQAQKPNANPQLRHLCVCVCVCVREREGLLRSLSPERKQSLMSHSVALFPSGICVCVVQYVYDYYG